MSIVLQLGEYQHIYDWAVYWRRDTKHNNSQANDT